MHLGSPAGNAPENFKVNFRKGWYANVESVTANPITSGVQPEDAATGAPGAAASGFTRSIVPRPPRDMRLKPIEPALQVRRVQEQQGIQ